MFIYFSGSKNVTKPVGWVADYCSNCRAVRAFELLRVGVAQHVYFISTGEGQLQGHRRRCGTCNVQVLANPADYAGTERRALDDVQALAAKTFPKVFERHAIPLEQVKRLRERPGAIPQEVRDELFFESFRLFNPLVEHRCANWSDFDKYSCSGCLVTIAVVIVFFNRSCQYTGDTAQSIFHAGFYALFAGFLVTLVLAMSGPGRYMKHCIIPGLVRGMAQFNPSPDEIARVVRRSRELGLRIGRKVKARTLIEALAAGDAQRPVS